MSEHDANRLRNWARAYERLTRGGLGDAAHTACVDDFADDEGNYPYVTAADILALLDEIEALRAKVERVEALAESARLEPAENMALTIAWHQVERGETPIGDISAVCVIAPERIRRAALGDPA